MYTKTTTPPRCNLRISADFYKNRVNLTSKTSQITSHTARLAHF